MEIKSDFNLVTKIENENYDINYGVLKKGEDTKVVITFKGIEHLSVRKSCGCTMPTIELLPEGGFNLIIVYDNKKIGNIVQSVWETVIDKNKQQKVVTFNLNGLIKE